MELAEEIRRRFVTALEAMDQLVADAEEREQYDEVYRLKAKREGLALGLSYIQQEMFIAHQQQGVSNGR